MEKLIEEFLSFLLRERAASTNTVNSYSRDLEQFSQFCSSEKKSFRELDQEIIKCFLNWLEQKEYASTSINRKLAALRSFLNWLEMEGKIRENPARGIPPFQTVERPAQPLTNEEIERLLAIPAKSLDPIAIRDLAIMELLLNTGMNISELVKLDVEMVSLEGGQHFVLLIKEGEERQIPISPRVVETVRQYLSRVRPILLRRERERALFLNQRDGGRLTRCGCWYALKNWARVADLPVKKVGPRVLRNTFIARQVASGVSTKKLQELLGHAQYYTTLVLRKRVSPEN